MQKLQTKKQKYFSLPEYQLAKNLILVFVLYETTKKGKSKFIANYVGIIVATIFM